MPSSRKMKMNTTVTAQEPITNQYMQAMQFREKFVDRQKDMTIAVLLSRAFTEMRYRCRHDYRGTDIPMMASRLELTDNVNQMVYDLSLCIDGEWEPWFKVYTFWDRKQSNNVFMRVFEYDGNRKLGEEPVIDMEVPNMATLDPVFVDGRNVKGPTHAINCIRAAFVEIGACRDWYYHPPTR